jgi:hypothetical protein
MEKYNPNCHTRDCQQHVQQQWSQILSYLLSNYYSFRTPTLSTLTPDPILFYRFFLRLAASRETDCFLKCRPRFPLLPRRVSTCWWLWNIYFTLHTQPPSFSVIFLFFPLLHNRAPSLSLFLREERRTTVTCYASVPHNDKHHVSYLTHQQLVFNIQFWQYEYWLGYELERVQF